MKISLLILTISALLGCSPSRMTRTDTIASEQATQDIAIQTVAVTPVEAKQPESPKREMPDETEIEETAMEPISIGGAALVCLYPQNQKQGSDAYTLNCNVEAANEISAKVAKVEFYKIDSVGTPTRLAVPSQNLDLLTFVIQETAETFFHPSVQMVLYAANDTSATMKTTPASMSLGRIARFWLGGEPNNAVETGVDEDCTEYQNMAMKQQSEASSGLPTGALGRLNDNQCSTVQRFVCKSSKAKDASMWVLSTYQGPFADYAKACPSGYQFALPMNEKETAALNALVDQSPAPLRYWVALDDRETEGRFVIVKK